MTAKDTVAKAVRDGDAYLAGAVADALRFKHGMTYEQVFEFAHNVTGIERDQWESLMYEADCAEGG